MPNVCLLPTKDAYIDENQPNTNYGSDGVIAEVVYVGGTKTIKRRGLITFQIGSEVTSPEVYIAELRLWCLATYGAVAARLHRLTQDWTEAGVTWNKYDGTNAWATAGGDYSSAVGDYVDFNTPASASTWMTLDVTTLTKDAITSRSGLLNMIVKLVNETPAVNAGSSWMYREFVAGVTWRRPRLVIVRPPFGRPMEV